MANPRAARIIGDRYQLGRVIGRGGMATIHEAMDLRLERPVAIKLLKPEVARDADLADRFRREALAATVLRHPNIVACLDTGTDTDQPYIVMDLVDGEDLAARLKRGGRLAPDHAARVGLDVARALGVAHARGIVHRDVKPGNILLAQDGRAMVTDFGIARLAADAEAARPGTTLGSVHYFSPEQARGATTTPASDVYGLGLVLYEALTGSRAFSGETTDAIALARIDAPPPSPRAIRPEIPVELDAVVRHALGPDPDDRYPNGTSMASALEEALRATDDTSPTTVIATPIVSGSPGPEPARTGRPARARGRPASRPAATRATARGARRGGPSAVAITLLALIGVVGGALVVAALPGQVPEATPSEAAVTTPSVSPSPSPTPSPSPSPSPSPTPEPTPETPAPTPLPEGEVADLCEVFFDIPCGLGAGRYAPSRFGVPFEIELGEGWSAVRHGEDVVVLTRPEGTFTLATGLREVYPGGESDEARSNIQDLMEAFIATEGVGATDPVNVRIDRRRGLSSDLEPVGSDRVPLFSTAENTFHLEPDRATRIVVVDLPGDDTVVLAIEPNEGHDLRDILTTADPAAGTIDWR